MKWQAKRLSIIPPYPFADWRKKIAEKKAKGVDVISLGIGDPDLPTADHVLNKLWKAATDKKDPTRHRYGGDVPVVALNEAIASYYKKKYGVSLDSKSEVLQLIGSKEGIVHLPLAVLDPSDVVLIPDPGYPPYRDGTLLAGGKVHYLPLLGKNNFLPDLDSIPSAILKKAKILWLNYPNNPTSAIAPLSFFKKAVAFCKKHTIILAHDAAYSEITFDKYKAPSPLEIAGAKDVTIEFGSLSKTYNMTGWRVGFVAGNKDVIASLSKLKDSLDSGVARPIQWMGVEALEGSQKNLNETLAVYARRKKIALAALSKIGITALPSPATFYIFAKAPKGMTGDAFAAKLLDEQAVVVTPGGAFGPSGKDWFRISLTSSDERLKEAMDRIGKLSL